MSDAHCLGHTFTQPQWLKMALTHRSAAGLANNERLEFLGDRVLNLAIAELLLELYPEASEGQLAPRHAQAVSAATLAVLSAQLGLAERLQLGKGELRQHGATKPNILADALEAVLGAIFLDGGWQAARQVVRQHWQDVVTALAPQVANPKSRLQEWLQGQGQPLPTYHLSQQSGPAHARHFVVTVVTATGAEANGEGASRQAAEQAAAAQLLTKLGIIA